MLADAERIVVGALIQPAVGREMDLPADDFAEPVHRAVVIAFNRHRDSHPRIDLEALAADVVAECGDLAALGGAAYLRNCIALSGRVGTDQVEQAAAVIRDAACRRLLLDVAEDLQSLAADTVSFAFEAPEMSLPGGAEHAAFLRTQLIDLAGRISPLHAGDVGAATSL